jgi:hypothetical protein
MYSYTCSAFLGLGNSTSVLEIDVQLHMFHIFRAGILYINPGDLGWNPYVTSWIETREHQAEKANLTILFDKYVPSLQVV